MLRDLTQLERSRILEKGRLTLSDFAELFRTQAEDMPAGCIDLINHGQWGFERLSGSQRDSAVLEILKRIDSRSLSAVKDGSQRWSDGWGENLEAFRSSGGDLTQLQPKYIRPGLPVRLFGDLVKTEDQRFEQSWYNVFRDWLFLTTLSGHDHIYEFGCGSGYNVARLAQLYPEKEIVGLDWVQPSVDIVNGLHETHGMKTCGRLFNFLEPDDSLEFPDGSIVLTMCALEQIGSDHSKFIDFLLTKKPTLVVNIEPVLDWYDPDSLVDYLAIRAHERRGFLSGYLSKLQKLEIEGRINIQKASRTYFGSMLHEAYSQIIWTIN